MVAGATDLAGRYGVAVSWRVHSSRALAHNLRAALPDTAVVAVTTADDEGYSVDLSDGCSADGRFEIGSITKTMTGAVLASLVDDGTRIAP